MKPSDRKPKASAYGSEGWGFEFLRARWVLPGQVVATAVGDDLLRALHFRRISEVGGDGVQLDRLALATNPDRTTPLEPDGPGCEAPAASRLEVYEGLDLRLEGG